MKRYVLLRAKAREIIEDAMKAVVEKNNALPPPDPPPLPAGSIAAALWYKTAIAADDEAEKTAKLFPKTQELPLLKTVTIRNARRTHSGRNN